MFDNKSVHRTFAATTGTVIVDERSQQIIGWAETQGKATILLGGQGRKPVSQSSDRRRVSVKNAEGGIASFMTPGKSVFAFTAIQYLPNVFKYFQE